VLVVLECALVSGCFSEEDLEAQAKGIVSNSFDDRERASIELRKLLASNSDFKFWKKVESKFMTADLETRHRFYETQHSALALLPNENTYIDIFINFAKAASLRNRLTAISALGCLHKDKVALDTLVQLASDSELDVRYAVAKIFTDNDIVLNETSAIKIMLQFLSTEEVELRTILFEIICRHRNVVNSNELAKFLCYLVNGEGDKSIRLGASSVSREAENQLLPGLKTILKDRGVLDGRAYIGAFKLLASREDSSLIFKDEIIMALGDDVAGIRRIAISALNRSSKFDVELRSAIEKKLMDVDSVVRERAKALLMRVFTADDAMKRAGGTVDAP